MTAEVFEAVQSNIKQCQEANDVVENTEKSVDAMNKQLADLADDVQKIVSFIKSDDDEEGGGGQTTVAVPAPRPSSSSGSQSTASIFTPIMDGAAALTGQATKLPPLARGETPNSR